MKQINPEYLAKLVDYEGRKESTKDLISDELSVEQKNALTAEVDLLQQLVDDFDLKVREWEGISKKEKIDHQTGEIK